MTHPPRVWVMPRKPEDIPSFAFQDRLQGSDEYLSLKEHYTVLSQLMEETASFVEEALIKDKSHPAPTPLHVLLPMLIRDRANVLKVKDV